MKLHLLGTGGVLPIPRPCCSCKLCAQAREQGFAHWQTGPSLFVCGADLLFDTPEEIRIQLVRANIPCVRSIILTHWHPDHTQGLRVIEQITKRRPEAAPVHVYIAPHQLDLLVRRGCGNLLRHYEKNGLAAIHNLRSGETLRFGALSVTPVFIQKTQGYYFLLSDDAGGRCVYAPCEYHGLLIPAFIKDIDVFIPHCLWFEHPGIGNGIKFSDTEDSFEQMLAHARQMNAKKIIVTHIEESFGCTLGELNRAAGEVYPGFDILFARDNTVIEI